MKDFIIRVDHIDPSKRHTMVCKILTHMKNLGYTTVDRYPTDGEVDTAGYITTAMTNNKPEWGMCMTYLGLCGDGECGDCSCHWLKVKAEDFLKFTAADVSDKKVVNCKIDLDWCKGLAREVISETIQKKLFEAGCKWASGDTEPIIKHAEYMNVVDNMITWSSYKTKFDDWNSSEVSVNNALKGNFWTYSTNKEEPKPEGYKVSLAAYTGKAREAVSKAIQEEAFKKGYGWGCVFTEHTIQNTESMFVYFDVSTKSILQDSTANAGYFDSHKYKELSVEEILSGALPKVN